MPSPIQVTLDNYVQLSARTEAPITEAILDRVADREIASTLITLLDITAKMTGLLDVLKKYIFYGKAIPGNFMFSNGRNLTPEILENLQNPETLRLLHAVLGVATEAGELVADEDKAGNSKGILSVLNGFCPVDSFNFLEEAGDVEWYIALLIGILNGTLGGVLQTNHDKLLARYPDKFTEDCATVRDLDAERTILEATC